LLSLVGYAGLDVEDEVVEDVEEELCLCDDDDVG